MKTIAIVLLTAGFVFLSGCKKNPISPNCSEEGKLVAVCGSYLLINRFIETEDGLLLYVYQSSAAFQWNTAYDGMPVHFSYEVISDASAFDEPGLSCVSAKAPAYTPVKITCISTVEK